MGLNKYDIYRNGFSWEWYQVRILAGSYHIQVDSCLLRIISFSYQIRSILRWHWIRCYSCIFILGQRLVTLDLLTHISGWHYSVGHCDSLIVACHGARTYVPATDVSIEHSFLTEDSQTYNVIRNNEFGVFFFPCKSEVFVFLVLLLCNRCWVGSFTDLMRRCIIKCLMRH